MVSNIWKWLNTSIWPINGTLTGASILGESGPGSKSNERVLYIPQSSRNGASPSDVLVWYPGHTLVGGSYSSSAKMQSVYPTATTDWANTITRRGTPTS